jgi:hypothetical protein
VSARTPPVNLDVLALALLCCLLASVVGVLVLGEPPPPSAPPEETPQPDAHDLAPTPVSPSASSDDVQSVQGLLQQSRELRTRTQEIVQVRAEVIRRLDRAAFEHGHQDLETRVAAIDRKLALLARIQAAEEEPARPGPEAQAMPESRGVPGPLGDYKGPYVLLECIEDSALVHPGRTRIEMNPAEERLVALVTQIREAGFVALAVRPAGWYNNSFDRLRTRIYALLDEAERTGGKRVGRTTFPVEAFESIDPYLPAHRTP